MDDIAHGQFYDFPTDGTGNIGNLNDSRRNVPGRGFVTDGFSNPVLQTLIQRDSIAQFYKQHHPHIVIPLLAHTQAFKNFIQVFYLPVNFGCTNAHAAGIQGGVRAAKDDIASVFRSLGKVSLRPHTGYFLKVGGFVFAAVIIVPEEHRHGGEGP